MTTIRKKVILTNRSQRFDWFEPIQAKARQSKVWEYVNPDSTSNLILEYPEYPVPLANTTAVSDAQKAEYKSRIAMYNKQSAAIDAIFTYVNESIGTTAQSLIQDKEEIRDILKTLFTYFKPSDQEKKREISRKWNELKAGTYGEARKFKLAGFVDTNQPLYGFIGALQQWKIEKWACRRLDGRSNKNFVMTRGNGAQHAIAIISDGHGLDLEDLATGFANVDSPTISLFSQLSVIVLGILWVALLITASGLTDDSWYLIAVGGIGMLQNIFVAGWKRTPDAYGIPLEFVDVIGEAKVMSTLMELEKRYEKLGKSMLGTFFPGDLREKEVEEWAAIAVEWKEKKAQAAKPVEVKNN